jgi:hypothetical protein
MSKDNLKISMRALGADLNNPLMMKNTLRNLVHNMGIGINVTMRGVDMSAYDPYGYDQRRPYDLLAGSRPGSAYDISDEVLINLRLPESERSGMTTDEFVATPQVQGGIASAKRLEELAKITYNDTLTGLQMDGTGALERMNERGFPGITLEEMQLLDADVLRDKFDIIMGDAGYKPVALEPEVPSAGIFTPGVRRAIEDGTIGLPAGVTVTREPQ